MAPPSQAEIDLSMFLFGVEPAARMVVANPTGLAICENGVLVCDATLDTVLRWDRASGEFTHACKHRAFDHPFAIDIAPWRRAFRVRSERRAALRLAGERRVLVSA